MKLTRLFSPLILGIVLLSPTVSRATTVESQTLETLVSRAGLIVEGTVLASRTYWSSDGRLILTTTTIEVSESIKGSARPTVDVTTMGGRVGKTVLYLAGTPAFRVGENAIVFIEPSAGYLTVFGMGQGKFTVTNGQVSNSVAELSTPTGQPFAVSKVSVQSFKSEIRSILERLR